jgi:hypothetical protein
MNAKRRLKNVGYSQNYVKKSDFDPPFCIELPFLAGIGEPMVPLAAWQILTPYTFHLCGK